MTGLEGWTLFNIATVRIEGDPIFGHSKKPLPDHDAKGQVMIEYYHKGIGEWTVTTDGIVKRLAVKKMMAHSKNPRCLISSGSNLRFNLMISSQP